MTALATALRAAALGAAAMYLLDPDRGRRRRALARDKSVRLAHRSADFVASARSDAVHRLRALRATAQRARNPGPAVSDEVLVERVRARLGRVVAHPHAVHVEADQGRVRLIGPILVREHLPLMVAVRLVRGVHAVDDQALVLHRHADGVSALQGESSRTGMRWLRDHWTPAVRLSAIAGGGLVALSGLRCRGLSRFALSAAGLGLVARAAINRPFDRMLPGGGTSRPGRHDEQAAAHDEDTTDDWTRGEPVDRELDAEATAGGPQVHSLPNAPSDWERVTGQSRSSVTLSEDPGRPLDALGGVDDLGSPGDREAMERRAGRQDAGPSGPPGGAIASQTLPLQQTGAADARGHRHADRDPGPGRALPDDSNDGGSSGRGGDNG